MSPPLARTVGLEPIGRLQHLGRQSWIGPFQTLAHSRKASTISVTGWSKFFPTNRSIVIATDDLQVVQDVREAMCSTSIEILSLADLGELLPEQDPRNPRENARLTAVIAASRVGLRAVTVVRRFTIDPLFDYSPNPELSHTRDYPTWSWQIPPQEPRMDLLRSVRSAETMVNRSGYCGPDDRGAYFLTTFYVATPDGDLHSFEGLCAGSFGLSSEAFGSEATGIDFAKCLVPAGHTAALAALDRKTQIDLSDYHKAARVLAEWLAPPR